MPEEIELVSISLPGRGERIDEAHPARLEHLADAIATAIQRSYHGQIAFFGHSLGALLAYAVAIRLQGAGVTVCALVASGSRPPWVPPPVILHRLDDDRLLHRIERMGGLIPGKATDTEFRERFLPLVRTDLAMCEGYHASAGRVEMPVYVWGSRDDWYAPPHIVRRWAELDCEQLAISVGRGHHFAMREDDQSVARLVAALRQSDALYAA